MQLPLNSLAPHATRLRTPFLLMAAALLLGVALAGCKTNPANLYQTGYDKRLTAERWAARTPDEAVVVIGGYPSVWQKSDEKGYAFETRPRITLGWSGGYDVVLVKAGTYEMQTILGANGSFADFGGIRGLGAASGPVIASFEVGPGQVVYVGNLNAPIQVDGATQCWVDLSVANAAPHVTESFAKQVPYVTAVPVTALMTVKESFIRFPCGRDG